MGDNEGLHMRRILTVLGVAAILLACSPAPAPKSGAPAPVAESAPIVASDTVIVPASRWTCADGQSIDVTFYGEPDRAELALLGGGKLNLYGSVAASGVLYEDTTHSFHTKGDEALLTSGDKTTTCRKEAPQ